MTQIQDLPDTEEGTFSVTFTYGWPAPVAGLRAALALAEHLFLEVFPSGLAYPPKTRSLSRQGVTANVQAIDDLAKLRSTGIYDVDAWLEAVNPCRMQRQAVVWSPDIGRPRRQAGVTTS